MSVRHAKYGLLLFWALLVNLSATAAMSGFGPIDYPEEFRRVSRMQWHADLPIDTHGKAIQALVTDSNLIICGQSNFLACFSASTGSNKWQVPHDGRNIANLYAGAGLAILQTLDWTNGNPVELTAFDLGTGVQLWRETVTASNSPPVFLDETMVLACGDRLRCSIPKSRIVKWERQFVGLRLPQGGVIGPDLIVALTNSLVARVDGATGELKWQTALPHPSDAIWTDAGQVYVRSLYETTTHCISGDNGTNIWTAKGPLVTTRPLKAGRLVVLLGEGHWYSDFYGLVVVNSKNGEPVWRTGGDGSVSSAALSGDFLYYQRGNSLNIYDLARGVERGHFVWDDTFYLLQGPRSSLILVSEKHGITCFRPNVIQLLTERDMPLFQVDAGFFKGFFHVAILLLAIVALVRLGTGGKRVIPGTSDTFAQVAALWAIWACLVAILIHTTVIVWALGVAHALSPAYLISSLGLILPLTLIPLAYLTSSRLLLRQSSRGSSQEMSAILAEVDDLQARMAIQWPVIVKTGRAGTSPFVFSFARRYFLILPADFSKTILLATGKDEELAGCLRRLVIAHEMAHIRSGDTDSFPMLQASRLLWLAFCPGLLVLAWARLAHAAELCILIQPTVIVGTAAAGVCFFIARVVLGAKEKYADGLASLFIPPTALKALIAQESEGSNVSVLHKYVFGLGLKKQAHFKFSGFGFSIKKIAQAASIRGSELENKVEVINRGHALKPILALSAALAAAVIVEIANVEKLLLFYQFLVAKFGTIDGAFLKGMDSWTDFPGAAASSVAMALAGVLLAAVILVPLRDSHRESDLIDGRSILKTLFLLAGAIVISNIAIAFLWPIAERGVLNFAVLGLQRSVSMLSVAGAAGILWLSMVGRWAKNLADGFFTLIQLAIGLTAAFTAWTVIIVYFDGIPLSSRILLAISASMAAGIILNLGYEIIVGRDKRYDRDGLTYCRLLSLRWIRISFDASKDRWLLFNRSCASLLLTQAMPVLIFAALAYPHLIALDQWYADSTGIVIENLHRMTSLPISEVIQRKNELWLNNWFAIAMTHLGGPGKLSASGVILFLSSVGLMVGVLFTSLVRVRSQGESNRQEAIDKMPLLMKLSEEFDCDLIVDSNRDLYRQGVHRRLRPGRPYVQGVERVPLMVATCEAVLVPDALTASEREQVIAWLLKCAAEDGGFGYAPDSQPDVLHTHAALEVLVPSGTLGVPDLARHKDWLLVQVRAAISGDMVFRPSDGLAHIYRILMALRSVPLGEHLMPEEGEHLQCLCLTLWRDSIQSEEATFFLVETLAALGTGASALPNDVMRKISSFEDTLRHIDPTHRLQELYYVIRMIHVLYPAEYSHRESVQLAKDNVQKTYFPPPGFIASFFESIMKRRR